MKSLYATALRTPASAGTVPVAYDVLDLDGTPRVDEAPQAADAPGAAEAPG
jgi:hypothetical protein